MPKSVGVDIGTSSIKIVELSRFGKGIKLNNYAQVKSADLGVNSLRVFNEKNYLLFKDKAAQALRKTFRKADIKPKQVTFSLPDFSSFFTAFELPEMKKEEIEKAVRFRASKYIPVPLTNLAVDWKTVTKKPLRVLVVAIPKQALDQYKKLAEKVDLRQYSLEPEAFSIDRAFPREQGQVYCFVDIGVQSSTISISNGEGLRNSHGLDISGGKITQAIQRALDIPAEEAEILKREKGLASDSDELSEAILPVAESLAALVERTLEGVEEKAGGLKVDKIIVLGGSARIPGLIDYFRSRLEHKVELANPFAELDYPPKLDNTLEDMGSVFSVAIGAARRNL